MPVPISTPFIGSRIASPTAKPPRMQTVRKHPPAFVEFDPIAALWQTNADNSTALASHGERLVEQLYRRSGNEAWFNKGQ